MHASIPEPPAPKVQSLKPGEWTIIIAHESCEVVGPKYANRPSEERMRYAFITALSSGAAAGEVVIADMESFLHRVITQDQGPYERQGSAQLLERLD
jgi:hypothetical protein